MSPIQATVSRSFDVICMSPSHLTTDLQANLSNTAESMALMHREMAISSSNRRTQAQDRRVSRATSPQFTIGDFVLVGVVCTNLPKLAIQWRGPKVVVQALSDWIYVVEDLTEPKIQSTHHQAVCASSRNRSTMLQNTFSTSLDIRRGHCVREITNIRKQGSAYQLYVQWMGLNDLEATWEPLSNLAEDVPLLVKAYLKRNQDNPLARAALLLVQHEREQVHSNPSDPNIETLYRARGHSNSNATAIHPDQTEPTLGEPTLRSRAKTRNTRLHRSPNHINSRNHDLKSSLQPKARPIAHVQPQDLCASRPYAANTQYGRVRRKPNCSKIIP